MFNRIIFIFKEFIRTLKKDPFLFLRFFNLSILNYCCLCFLFVFLFNANYIKEIFHNNEKTSESVNTSLLTMFIDIKYYHYIVYTIMIVLLISLLYLNKKYLLGFINNYRPELKLISKFNLKNKLKRSPLVYAAILGNVVSLITAWGLVFVIYKVTRSYLLMRYLNVFLLEYSQFKLTLLLFLLISGLGTGLPVAVYLYWSVSRKW